VSTARVAETALEAKDLPGVPSDRCQGLLARALVVGVGEEADRDMSRVGVRLESLDEIGRGVLLAAGVDEDDRGRRLLGEQGGGRGIGREDHPVTLFLEPLAMGRPGGGVGVYDEGSYDARVIQIRYLGVRPVAFRAGTGIWRRRKRLSAGSND